VASGEKMKTRLAVRLACMSVITNRLSVRSYTHTISTR